jgi:lysophospholipase L1-like esterase
MKALLHAFIVLSSLMTFSTPQQTPASRTRIVALGDSTTAGTPGWKSALEAPPRGKGDETSQYAYWLMEAHPEWDVLNRGVNGERSDEIGRRFQRDVIDQRPNAVVIIAGVNDVYQGRRVEHVIEQLRGMYERAKAAGIRVVAGTIVPYNTATPEQNDKMRRINEWILSDAGPAVLSVDTRKAVAAPGDLNKLADSPDSLHPSAAGYRLMAEAISPVLERALK